MFFVILKSTRNKFCCYEMFRFINVYELKSVNLAMCQSDFVKLNILLCSTFLVIKR
jgi:hypothetical protein